MESRVTTVSTPVVPNIASHLTSGVMSALQAGLEQFVCPRYWLFTLTSALPAVRAA